MYKKPLEEISKRKYYKDDYTNCKNVFCDKTCNKFYKIITPKTRKYLKQDIKNGFVKMTSKQRNTLKKKGARSACIYTRVYLKRYL